jgi:hypothetical protein
VVKHYRSKAAFEKAAAYVHIHHVPHHPQREVIIAGHAHFPEHHGEHTGQCVNCGGPASHHHGKHGCCGSERCHTRVNFKHASWGEDGAYGGGMMDGRLPMSMSHGMTMGELFLSTGGKKRVKHAEQLGF